MIRHLVMKLKNTIVRKDWRMPERLLLLWIWKIKQIIRNSSIIYLMKREREMVSWIKIFVPWENIYSSFLYFRLNGNENKWRHESVAKNAKTLRLRFYKNPRSRIRVFRVSYVSLNVIETLRKPLKRLQRDGYVGRYSSVQNTRFDMSTAPFDLSSMLPR